MTTEHDTRPYREGADLAYTLGRAAERVTVLAVERERRSAPSPTTADQLAVAGIEKVAALLRGYAESYIDGSWTFDQMHAAVCDLVRSGIPREPRIVLDELIDEWALRAADRVADHRRAVADEERTVASAAEAERKAREHAALAHARAAADAVEERNAFELPTDRPIHYPGHVPPVPRVPPQETS